MTSYNITDIQSHSDHMVETYNSLAGILNEYPRRCGTMVMISPDTEDRIEAMCHAMEDDVEYLSSDEVDRYLTPAEKAQLTEVLEAARGMISTQQEEIAAAREFLSRYYSH